MNSNQANQNQKPKSQINKTSKITSISNAENVSQQKLSQNISPINRISILKTEEQKEVVRTNVYEPNDSKSGNDQHFCVVTEVIRRSSNISFDPQHNAIIKDPMNFSFNRNVADQQINQSFQNKSIKIHIADSENSKKCEKNEYKLLVRKIANQLKNKVRAPTQGFFYFAFQKGNYPILIIRKLKKQIINHSIEFNNDLFRIYSEKYIKYKELIKRIAFLLKQRLKNAYFWKNEKYSSQKISQPENENSTISVILTKNTSKMNRNNKSTNKNANLRSKSPNCQKKPINNNNNTQNTKNINNKNVVKKQNNNNNITTYGTNNILQNQKKTKIQNNKTTINNFKSNSNHPNSNNRNNLGIISHKNNFINPFNNNKEGKKANLTKKSDSINKNPFNKKSQLNNKDKNQNKTINNTIANNNLSINKNNVTTERTLFSSTTYKNEKTINTNINNFNNINNEKKASDNEEIRDLTDNKMDIIEEETKKINNNDNPSNKDTNSNSNTFQNRDVNLNMMQTQSEPILYTDASNDIEMKDNFNKINSDVIVDKNKNIFERNNINSETINTINNNIMMNNNIAINNQNINANIEKINNEINARLNDKQPNDNTINNAKSIPINFMPNNNNRIKLIKNNNSNNNNSLVSMNKSKKGISIIPKKKIEIKLSVFTKDEEKKIANVDKSAEIKKDIINNNEITTSTTNMNKNIDINSITFNNVNNFSNVCEEHINYVNKFNDFLINNNLLIQFNIPTSMDIKGQNYLKQSIFWEKYVHYIYFNYLINNNKISLFSFVQLIEQYFLWCENATPEINLKFKKLIIDTMNKIYNEKEINQFLSMNKISNLDELFKKYETFINSRNKKDSYICGKEIEIKINNIEQCNCNLCCNEIACQNKMSEINKNLITHVNTDNFNFKGNISVDKKENENNKNVEDKKNNIFSKSKTIHSFESIYQYIPIDKNENDRNDRNLSEITEKKEEETKKMTNPKKEKSSQNKSRYKTNENEKSSLNNKKEIEKFLDVPENTIDSYFNKENKNEKEKENENENNENNQDFNVLDEIYKNRKKKEKKNKKRKSTNKYKEEKNESIDDEENEKEKNKKRKKSQKRNKNKTIIIKDSENEGDNDGDDNDSANSEKKKGKQYPKISKKSKGKKY